VQFLSAEPSLPCELERDGVGSDDYGRNPKLRAALSCEIQLPETDDEVNQLLKSFQFMSIRPASAAGGERAAQAAAAGSRVLYNGVYLLTFWK
jgi:hypothetical protein